ncbi:hypothetical protein EVAR_100832_1 [Eumeta japonica]|uniref:Zinc finger BED domain-containing protein 4 n=1 Tax=Eumeta variegata TaxID=151549 RepID=A0A4C1T465_EUMVA|nr:hypothetical protein EVAR_100832_1 [Eumeta japonica]
MYQRVSAKSTRTIKDLPHIVITTDIWTRYIYTLGLDTTGIEAFARTTSCSASLSTSYNLQAELTTEEWIMMEKVVNILRYFEETTKSVSKSTATLSDAIPLINSLRKLLENRERVEEDDPCQTLSSNNSLKEVEKYLRSPNIPRAQIRFTGTMTSYPHLKKLAQKYQFKMSSVASEAIFPPDCPKVKSSVLLTAIEIEF